MAVLEMQDAMSWTACLDASNGTFSVLHGPPTPFHHRRPQRGQRTDRSLALDMGLALHRNFIGYRDADTAKWRRQCCRSLPVRLYRKLDVEIALRPVLGDVVDWMRAECGDGEGRSVRVCIRSDGSWMAIPLREGIPIPGIPTGPARAKFGTSSEHRCNDDRGRDKRSDSTDVTARRRIHGRKRRTRACVEYRCDRVLILSGLWGRRSNVEQKRHHGWARGLSRAMGQLVGASGVPPCRRRVG
ncbi:hypothetical protein L227DRAFT_292274 [Lentinus tigrinus ALCF2SS1-6]|uniref:Uncharacterized protein n=1 Tax=Lentinus tigrinus ALCF2SS1-6 TaxID=1328759 RepID=A0A5C2RYF1_9APHY|nr:hypothetical protein L227DRAFT_292274 [Lentinus tigrinus ALCF2SS1-6]